MKPTALHPVELMEDESPHDHAFAHVNLYRCDVALLHYLLQDLRVMARHAHAGKIELAPYEKITWTVHGLARRTIICDPDRFVAAADMSIVGFLGDRRSSDEARQIDTSELEVIDEFPRHRGLISYSSVELVDNQWANLVLHAVPADRDEWRHNPIHIQMAELLAPNVYHNVRIHNGCLRGGPLGTNTITIGTTKYFDYDTDPMWHAIRRLHNPKE